MYRATTSDWMGNWNDNRYLLTFNLSLYQSCNNFRFKTFNWRRMMSVSWSMLSAGLVSTLCSALEASKSLILTYYTAGGCAKGEIEECHITPGYTQPVCICTPTVDGAAIHSVGSHRKQFNLTSRHLMPYSDLSVTDDECPEGHVEECHITPGFAKALCVCVPMGAMIDFIKGSGKHFRFNFRNIKFFTLTSLRC